jgi:hypothetical protein
LDEIGGKIGTGWQVYFTLTFANHVHPESALKAFKFWFRSVENGLFSRRQINRGYGLVYVLCQERQNRGVLHFHGLMGGDERLTTMNKRELGRRWYEQGVTPRFEESGEWIHHRTGIARVEGAKHDGAVRAYVAKYVAKMGEGMEVHVPARMRASWGQLVTLKWVPVG